jgi:sarcosine oxidase subunit gamma
VVEPFRRRGALAALALDAHAARSAPPGTLTLCERPARGQLALRGDAADGALAAAVREVLGVELPLEPNTVGRGDDASVLWLGPDEWLAVMPEGHEVRALQALDSALAGTHALVSDVSHARAVVELSGTDARTVLAKGCSLDLHPRAFGPDRCAQSALARAHVLLHQLDETPAFDLYVHRSFMEYAWDWLVDAGSTHDLTVISERIGAR